MGAVGGLSIITPPCSKYTCCELKDNWVIKKKFIVGGTKKCTRDGWRNVQRGTAKLTRGDEE